MPIWRQHVQGQALRGCRGRRRRWSREGRDIDRSRRTEPKSTRGCQDGEMPWTLGGMERVRGPAEEEAVGSPAVTRQRRSRSSSSP